METRVLLLALECTCSETPSHASNLVLLLALVLLAPVALVAPVLPLELALTTEVLLVPIAKGGGGEEGREERDGGRGWRGEGGTLRTPGVRKLMRDPGERRKCSGRRRWEERAEETPAAPMMEAAEGVRPHGGPHW